MVRPDPASSLRPARQHDLNQQTSSSPAPLSQFRSLPGKTLPTLLDHIAIVRAHLHAVAAPPQLLRRNDGRARAEEGVVDVVGLATVVTDGATHALDGLLRAVGGVAGAITLGDIPH